GQGVSCPRGQGVSCSAWDPAPHCFAFPQTCLSIPDIKTAFSDCTSKIGRRDCLTQACSALTGKGVREGIEWMVKCVVRNVHRPPRQRDIT
ncbi:ADP-ribosylation factor-related protein 1-like, partial [Eumetopias jubatus]|uniref:ADP-ribosylation factor-related protein 1-like n=1 Tax=Eumetopias jubatus TaxID=34886 RepID=UPI001016F8CC